MRKVFLALMAIATIAMVSCKPKTEEPQPQPQPEPQPQSETYTVFYLSDYVANIVRYSYTDNNGETQTLTKDDWKAIDKNEASDSAFIAEMRHLLEARKIALTDEMLSHLKRFSIPNQPQAYQVKSVIKERGAELPEEGTIVITGRSTFGSKKQSAFIISYNPESTEDKKWEKILDIAKWIL